jgi:hypothetical protein
MVLIAVFLFLAVWIPCCTSDIIFPLLFSHTNDSWLDQKEKLVWGRGSKEIIG